MGYLGTSGATGQAWRLSTYGEHTGRGERYLLRAPWRHPLALLPKDFPPWQMVYYYCWVWRREGVLEGMNTVLREKERMRVGREPPPSAGVIDSQSMALLSGDYLGFPI